MSHTFWLRNLSRVEKAALVATFAGWMLDGMDVMIYSFVVPSLIALWNITTGQAGMLATAALLVSSAGGWLAGLGADRYGRVRLLQLSIGWFAFFTFLSGFTNSYHQLLIVRSLQGLGFGGEWAVGSVLVGETIRANNRGRAVGFVQSGWAIGWGVAALCFVVLFSVLPQQLAWRAMFWLGILPAALILYIRRRVSEPEIFSRSQQVRWSRIFSPDLLRTTALASLLSLGAQGGYYAVMTWLPLFLRSSRKLSLLDTGNHLALIIAGAFVGYLLSAELTDRLGRRATLVLFALGSLITVWSYTLLPMSNSSMRALGFLLGFFPSGSFSPMGSFFTELFPTSSRASGQGFSYNLGRGLGAFFPALVGYLSARLSLGTSIGIFASSAYLLMIVAAISLPETRGKNLTA
jgi:MFS family permease